MDEEWDSVRREKNDRDNEVVKEIPTGESKHFLLEGREPEDGVEHELGRGVADEVQAERRCDERVNPPSLSSPVSRVPSCSSDNLRTMWSPQSSCVRRDSFLYCSGNTRGVSQDDAPWTTKKNAALPRTAGTCPASRGTPARSHSSFKRSSARVPSRVGPPIATHREAVLPLDGSHLV